MPQAANAQAASGAEAEEEGKEEAGEKDKKKGKKKKPAGRKKRGSSALEPEVVCLASDGDEDVIALDNDRQTSGHANGKGKCLRRSSSPCRCLNVRDRASKTAARWGLPGMLPM